MTWRTLHPLPFLEWASSTSGIYINFNFEFKSLREICISDEDIEYQAVINQWLTKQPSESKEFLKQVLNSYLYNGN